MIPELNVLSGECFIRQIEQNQNVPVVFDEANRFTDYFDEYIEKKYRLFLAQVECPGNQFNTVVFINKDLDEVFRRYLLPEEPTQVPGLATDSQRDSDSIFP